jgi:hypothetical protein
VQETLNEDLTEYSSETAKAELKIVYNWMWSTLIALDLGAKGIISIAEDGPIISKGLSNGGLKHLWTMLLELCGTDDSVTPGKFIPVFWSWMGIDEAFEARVRAGM